MSFEILPKPDEEQLANAPLKLVVCQFIHETISIDAWHQRNIRIQNNMGSKFPEFLKGGAAYAILGENDHPEVLNTVEPSYAKYFSKDRQWIVTSTQNFFSLECLSFRDWHEFEKTLLELASLTFQDDGPRFEERIGLRFVDHIYSDCVEKPMDWRGQVTDSLLGPVSDPTIGGSVLSTEQAFEIEIDKITRATVRHGATTDVSTGQQVYILDIDVMTFRIVDFDFDSFIETVRRLYLCNLQIFQFSITNDFFAFLKTGEGEQ